MAWPTISLVPVAVVSETTVFFNESLAAARIGHVPRSARTVLRGASAAHYGDPACAQSEVVEKRAVRVMYQGLEAEVHAKKSGARGAVE